MKAEEVELGALIVEEVEIEALIIEGVEIEALKVEEVEIEELTIDWLDRLACNAESVGSSLYLGSQSMRSDLQQVLHSQF